MKDGCWSIISVYAPQTGCSEEGKDEFYMTLDDVIRCVPEGDFLTVAGDLNGHVGTDRRGRPRLGYLRHILCKEGKPEGDLQQWRSKDGNRPYPTQAAGCRPKHQPPSEAKDEDGTQNPMVEIARP
ncbi:unnamed protein product [Nippostrongylus brasiliensis]|uniref:Endo/exonuclease/phosphatase domain-containing protein n=1 Tax=Nippostrongylus brasiliensis TaxID=27835 RepID=A0A0N4Y8R6_NIPBR|nr:unnamed protein product [Nippostrongylus brasiliensis]